jgi:cation diffusion facilitator CzcD-associated flavoprotein CzcO
MPTRTPTLVIGAGPAGLATSACLKREGIDHVVLEREAEVAPRWRQHYERLHLHTYRDLSQLPFKRWKPGTPKYPSRQQVVDYLDDYAAELAVSPLFGQEVRRAARVDGGWRVETAKDVFETESLVIATGYNHSPQRPSWPGQEQFDGEILHSRDYRNGAPWKGKRVLVVGAGNSGAEIALDLLEHGAESSICIRGPIHFVARDIAGRVPAQIVGIALSHLPTGVADRLAVATSKMIFGDLSEFGIERPQMGPISQIRKLGRVPLIDVGTIEVIKSGQLPVVPGIERFHPDGVELVDGRRLDLDAVVLATGYTAGLESFLENTRAYLNERGYPNRLADAAEYPGPYFVGFGNPPTGLLREINFDAKAVAAAIAAARGS